MCGEKQQVCSQLGGVGSFQKKQAGCRWTGPLVVRLYLLISQILFQGEDTGWDGSECSKHTDHNHCNLGTCLKMWKHQSRAIQVVLLNILVTPRVTAIADGGVLLRVLPALSPQPYWQYFPFDYFAYWLIIFIAKVRWSFGEYIIFHFHFSALSFWSSSGAYVGSSHF